MSAERREPSDGRAGGVNGVGSHDDGARGGARTSRPLQGLWDWFTGAALTEMGRGRPAHLAAMGMLMALLAGLDYYTSPELGSLHLLYHRMYYVPILYGAFVFGLRGGVISGIAAALLVFPTRASDPTGLGVADYVNEFVMYVFIGGMFGWTREIEDKGRKNLAEVSRRLEKAYADLEEQTIEIMTMQEFTTSVLASIPTGVLTVGPDGSITTANRAAEAMLGMQEADMVPRSLAWVLEDDGGLQAALEGVLSGTAASVVHEATLVTRYGRRTHVRTSVAPMKDLNDFVLGAVITMEDVSQVKALTDQLVRADRLAALGELTTGVAHEIRNPLGIIRATVQLLDEQRTGPNKASEAVDVIMQEVDRLDAVVRALLDFGRPWKPTLVSVSLNRLVEEVVLLTEKWAKRSGVDIVANQAEGLPEVMADPHQIKQVFVNLVSNAVQAMAGGGTLTVTTSLEDAFVKVEFADTGPGMDAEVARKVFDPFFSTKADGTGLGLTIVHRIIDEHDGIIEVASEPGKGAVFTVRLPVPDMERAT
ncbi:MAG: hypothetical protein Kow0056_05030 [Coriobacteriia bacterium]